jgi:hypothetical protein
MQTPSDYFARYESFSVLSPENGGTLATGLSVDRYLLTLDQAHNDERRRLADKIRKDLAIRRRTDKSAKIRVTISGPDGDDSHEFDDLTFKQGDQLWALIRYPYAGKGSPEGVQAILQLGSQDLPGSPPIVSPPDFQAYCDRWLGLDCNGFVGNYLRHVVEEIDWWDVNATKSGVSPDNDIQTIWDSFGGEVRASADQVDFNDLNLLVMVNDTGKIIAGGKMGYGHIMISQPKEIDFDVGLKSTLGVADDEPVPGLYVLESTAGRDPDDGNKNGLVKSFYAYADYKPLKGVIRVRRGFNKGSLKVRIRGRHWSE